MGVEPTELLHPLLFKSNAISHSAILPYFYDANAKNWSEGTFLPPLVFSLGKLLADSDLSLLLVGSCFHLSLAEAVHLHHEIAIPATPSSERTIRQSHRCSNLL